MDKRSVFIAIVIIFSIKFLNTDPNPLLTAYSIAELTIQLLASTNAKQASVNFLGFCAGWYALTHLKELMRALVQLVKIHRPSKYMVFLVIKISKIMFSEPYICTKWAANATEATNRIPITRNTMYFEDRCIFTN